MVRARAKWLGGLVALVAIAATGAALWQAHARGVLAPAYSWFHRVSSPGDGRAAGNSGASMSMSGMDMGSMSEVSEEESSVPGHAAVTIPPEIQQRIGVTVGRIERAPLRMSVRTVGIIRPDETKTAMVHLKTDGWVEKLFVNYTGQKVRKGEPLLAIYSPDFLSTQQEYLIAHQGKQVSLAESARRRLELWDVPSEAIDDLERTGKPARTLTLRSPLSGTVLEKNVLEKEYVTAQKELYSLADLSTVWIQAKVYEYELPHIELDQPAAVTVPAVSDGELTGKVVFIQPTVEEATRTVQVRVELPNEDGLLKPGMFADVEIQHTMGEGLLAPASAVVRTGEQDIAYRVESEGRFVPVEVKISEFRFGDRFHVLEGLDAGDQVVTSAAFLIDSESRLRVSGGMMMPGMDMGDMKGMDHSQMERMDHPGAKNDTKGTDHSKMKY